MSDKRKKHGLAHLQDRPEAKEDVLVVDFDTLAVIDAVVSNVSQWGGCLKSDNAGELYKNIGIRTKGASKLIKAHVTAVKSGEATIVFATEDKSVLDKRQERRADVSIQVTIADTDGLTEISGTIVDAGHNGCKVKANGLTALPEEVLLTVSKFEKPIVAEFAWRDEQSAGLRLLWDRTLQDDEDAADAAFAAAELEEMASSEAAS
ncbi:PilZ domain-containing protein [Roseibium sp.]|uniref:PilZ domain-containing protein n=1 Tax=Roseibium sp. TaxID=1936156 RepID=UPI003D09E756